MDPNASLPRRSKSFKDQETQKAMAAVWHSKQLSTVTYVPPSPYQIKEIPLWLKEYVNSEQDYSVPWNLYSYEDLNGLDTMVHRMLRKGWEQIVRQFEYYRAAIEQEVNSRGTLRHRRPINQLRQGHSHFQYPTLSATPPSSSSSHNHNSHTLDPTQNHRHTPTYAHSHAAAAWTTNGPAHPQLAVYPSWSSSEHSSSSTRTLRANVSDLDLLQDTEETFV
jgi:hypothetical protein